MTTILEDPFQADGVLKNERPLLICDADEVLLQFVKTLEAFLQTNGFELRLKSFALTGNVYAQGSDQPTSGEEVSALIEAFFSAHVADCPPVIGAPEALNAISVNADIVILTNLPQALAPARERALADFGMPFPVISNDGAKGPKVAELAEFRAAPVVFVDDLPPHHASVARTTPQVTRVHFIADERLAQLISPSPDANHFFTDWETATPVIIDALTTRS